MLKEETIIKPSEKEQKQEYKYANGKWSKSEHARFLKAITEFGKNWNEIQRVVKTRNLSQVRSHAQKHFAKVKEEEDESCQMSVFSSEEDEEQRLGSTYKKKPETEEIKFETDINISNLKEGDLHEKKEFKECILGIFNQPTEQETLQIENGNQYFYNEHEKVGVEKMKIEQERSENEQRLFFFQSFSGEWGIFYLF